MAPFDVLRFVESLPVSLVSRVLEFVPVTHVEPFFHYPRTRSLARTRYYANVVLDMYDEAVEADQDLALKLSHEEFFDLLDARYEWLDGEDEEYADVADVAIKTLDVRFFGTFAEFTTLFEDHVVEALNQTVTTMHLLFKVGLGPATSPVDFAPFTCLETVWLTAAEAQEPVSGALLAFGALRKLTFDEGVLADCTGLQLPSSLVVLEMLNFKQLRVPPLLSFPQSLKSLEMLGDGIEGLENLKLPDTLQTLSVSIKAFAAVLPSWTFAYPPNLRTLALDGNGLSDLAPLGFERLPLLVTHVSLSFNKLTGIPSAITFPEGLRVLNLSNNLITTDALKRKLQERFTAKVYFDEAAYYEEACHEQFYQ